MREIVVTLADKRIRETNLGRRSFLRFSAALAGAAAASGGRAGSLCGPAHHAGPERAALSQASLSRVPEPHMGS